MIVVPVVTRNYHDELDQIRGELHSIKTAMPKKSAYQEELDSLLDTVIRQDETINKLQNKVNSLLSMNEELLKYIDNIEGIKNSGGVRCSVSDTFDFMEPRKLRIKTITIPEVKLAIVE